MKITIAGFRGSTPDFRDDELLIERLRERGAEASTHPWDADVDWDGFDLIVARTVWDYTLRYDEFVAWLRGVSAPIENEPELLLWNTDKRYLGDLGEAGIPVVETTYVEPGDEPPAIDRDVVIKPTVSGGGRNTGRFGPASAESARELIAAIGRLGKTAMVQPYLARVEGDGETAVVMVDGRVSHVLRKGAILAPDEVAPVRTDDELGVAEVMYDPELVVASAAADDELELADRVIGAIRERFGTTPLYARVDMLRDDAGTPVVLELEAVEPNFYFEQAPGADARLADAIVARARSRSRQTA
jgi:glutathione synthase/RimK-type ligase-like ATP-grasp enzyme